MCVLLYAILIRTLHASDHTIKVWSLEELEAAPNNEGPKTLSSISTVAAHDKDINSIAVAPNDSLVCTGSQVRLQF